MDMAEAERWTVLRLINWTRDYFGRTNLDEPRLSAEILLAFVLGCPRLALYTQFDRLVGPEHLKQFRRLIRRAAASEPVAYLVGYKEFYSLSFKVSPDVLVPRPETELLVDAALEMLRGQGLRGRLWDICTGSGCVAVAAAHCAPALSVLATDISAPALAVARENVQRHGLGARVRVEQADLLTLPASARDLAPFDIITANPPYIADDQVPHLLPSVRREPEVALRSGPTGLEHTRRILGDAPSHLRAGGLLAVELGLGTAEPVFDLLNQSGRYTDIRILKDAADIERTVLARRKPPPANSP
jgi:release factor glutamine methyltransferase